MSDVRKEIVRGAEQALTRPADADLTLLAALHQGLDDVSAGATPGLPVQRPPHQGEEGLASRQPR